MRPGQLPPFHHLGEYVFEDMCCDLLQMEPAISTCDHYGVRGQKQHGVDLVAHRRDGDGIDVAQCKCYARFSAGKVRAASDTFLRFWDSVWSEKGIKRFILLVACDLSRREQQETICEQVDRFRSKGVVYEAWSARTIRNKLRPHHSIVAAYCHPADVWVREICGLQPAAGGAGYAGPPGSAVSAALEFSVAGLSRIVSEKTSRELEAVREAWNEGNTEPAAAWLQTVRGDLAQWSALSPEAKAGIVAFEAIYMLQTSGDAHRSRSLVEEARGYGHTTAPLPPQRSLPYTNPVPKGP